MTKKKKTPAAVDGIDVYDLLAARFVGDCDGDDDGDFGELMCL